MAKPSLYEVLANGETALTTPMFTEATITESVESADNDRASALFFNATMTLP